MKLLHPLLLILGLLLGALSGCASTAPKSTKAGPGDNLAVEYPLCLPCIHGTNAAVLKPPSPSATPDSATFLTAWNGNYQGTGKVFVNYRGQWYPGGKTWVFIEPDAGNTVKVTGAIRGGGEPHSFVLGVVPVADGGRIEGETPVVNLGSSGVRKAEYALWRTGEKVKGRVKYFLAPHANAAFRPENEWVFAVQRTTTR